MLKCVFYYTVCHNYRTLEQNFEENRRQNEQKVLVGQSVH